MSKLPRRLVATAIAQRTLKPIPARQLAQEIAAYLLVNRRVSQLESVLRDVMQYRADQGIVEVLASAAHPLTDAVRADITAQLRGLYPDAKQIIISENLDDSLVGNIRLELANKQFDASFRTKLNHFKQLTAAGKA